MGFVQTGSMRVILVLPIVAIIALVFFNTRNQDTGTSEQSSCQLVCKRDSAASEVTQPPLYDRVLVVPDLHGCVCMYAEGCL
ncbi:hypothetical protein DUNSADRAFT_7168 [Dunaliella salina]|uniref:Encoded protein n=1 Tax=Dunaliella salina TaxID=3046 RepID=A0ABQ7FTJ3_DUNSA|nr:hypothetical protein DUNSADRAFT_7168 [Dunaliella salina]|eukprot:KAF5825759.1 hypothetical protein DUNSADRAFT_7168 [Dunaliella salina]